VQTAPFSSEEPGAIAEKHEKVKQMRWFLDSKHKDHADADGKITEEQKREFIKKFEADLITPAEVALWKRGASNAGYRLPRLRQDLRLERPSLRRGQPQLARGPAPLTARHKIATVNAALPLLPALLLASGAALHSADAPNSPLRPASPVQERPLRPSVGAIRWDAWSGGRVTEEVQRTLGPAKYHDRLPWFAEVKGDNQVRIDGSPPEIMDREINFAADAGLDYWAFLLYPESDAMSQALQQYLKSPQRRRLNFCVILHNAFGVPEAAWPRERSRLVSLLKEPGYQTVPGGRPLVFEFQARLDGKFPRQRFAEFRQAAREAGLNPYCVFMGSNPAADFRRESTNGFDAVSAYACASDVASYAELVRQVETGYWQNAARAKVPYVPLVTTGWDKQPRKDHPVSWEKDHSYHRQAVFPAQAAPAEIAAHLERALGFVRAHQDLCAANTVIIYAWNEHDEGGWLSPTWALGGKPNTARLDAIRRVLAPRGAGARIQTGVNCVFPPFCTAPEKTAAQTDTPVLVQIDLGHCRDARPDLWNWSKPAGGATIALKNETRHYSHETHSRSGGRRGKRWAVKDDRDHFPIAPPTF
jgi:hypothetical protein